MVGAVKKWQKSDPQKSKDTWNKLSEANSALEAQFNLLSKLAADSWDSYKAVITDCSMLKSEKWMEQFSEATHVEIVKALLGARDAMLKIRFYMRQMGDAAGIPIEPESQTRLLDVTMDTEGVLLGGVPGAGGFDAVFAITLSDSSTNLTKIWSSHNVLAMLVREDPRGVSIESGMTASVPYVREKGVSPWLDLTIVLWAQRTWETNCLPLSEIISPGIPKRHTILSHTNFFTCPPKGTRYVDSPFVERPRSCDWGQMLLGMPRDGAVYLSIIALAYHVLCVSVHSWPEGGYLLSSSSLILSSMLDLPSLLPLSLLFLLWI
nr:phosphomevalonate kinase [Tanacetum cinerariifolium]